MKYVYIALFIGLTTLFTSPLVSAKAIPVPGEATITLAANGQAKATIVIPADANSKEKLAAQALQHYVQAICDVKLPIHNDGKKVSGTGLYIGQCVPTKKTYLPAKKLNPESFAIVVHNGNIFFNGRWPSPTFWAVSSFIENKLGVHWFAPGKLWTYIPKGHKGNLMVVVKSHISVPDTAPRVWSGNSWFPDWKRWNLHNKVSKPEVQSKRNFQNNIYKIFPPSKYAKTHPEYYPLIDGKRYIPPNDHTVNWLPEMSNPEVIKKTAEYAHQYFQKYPNQDSFSLGQDDIAHLSDKDRANLPDSYYRFVNAVAKRLQKTDPGKYVGCLIYSIARTPPKTIKHMEPNVFGFITERCFQWWQPGKEAADHKLSHQWAKLCDHLSRYDYYGMGTMTPRFAPHYMAQQMKFDKSLGFEGMYIEAYTFMPDTAPMMWALAKMQWNSSLDVDDLLNEFYDDMYGQAAPVMKKYFNLLERAWTQNRPGRTHQWVHRNLVAQAQSMTVAQLDQGMAVLDRALEAAQSPKVKQRIKINRAGLRYGGYLIRGYALAQQIANATITDKQSALDALALVKKMATLDQQRQVFWAKADKMKNLLGETVRGLGDQKHYLERQATASMYSRGILSGLLKSLSWLAEHETAAQFNQQLNQLKKMMGDNGSFKQAIAASAVLNDKNAKNLIHNGDFEQPGHNTKKGNAQHGWTTKGAPPSWSFWSRNGKALYGVTKNRGRNHSSAAFIHGAVGSDLGVFLQTVKVKPGQTYLLTGHVRVSPPRAAGQAQIGVRFRKANGGWASQQSLKTPVITSGKSARWHQVIMLITIPKGAGGLVIMPSASDQSKTTTAWFDDLALYRVK